MTGVKQQIRTNQALQVIQHSMEGMTVIEACQQANIARSTFYYFVFHHPDAIASFQEMQEAAQLQQLALLLENQVAVLEKVIEDALSDTTKPRHRLAIYKELVKRTEELMREVNIHGAGQGDADFLQGPKLMPGVSRFSASEREASYKGEAIEGEGG